MTDKKNIKSKAKVRLSRKKVISENQFMKYLLNQEKIDDEIKGYLHIGLKQQDYQVLQSIPPNTILDQVYNNFTENTNIPAILPIQYLLSYVGFYLASKNQKIFKDKHQELDTSLYTIVLAESYSKKTLSSNAIKTSGVRSGMPDITMRECASYAALFDTVKKANNNSILWVQDEVVLFLTDLINDKSKESLRGGLLKAYDRQGLDYNTKKEGMQTLKNALISFYGIGVDETFLKNIDVNWLIDGFASRFNYIIAKQDETKDIFDYLNVPIEKCVHELENHFAKIIDVRLNNQYLLTEKWESILVNRFRMMFTHFENLPKAFIGRLFFSTIQYALIYHFILCKDSDLIDEDDLTWACRHILNHIQAINDIFNKLGASDIKDKITKVEELVQRYKAEGKVLKPRNIVINHRNITSNTEEARTLIKLATE